MYYDEEDDVDVVDNFRLEDDDDSEDDTDEDEDMDSEEETNDFGLDEEDPDRDG